MTYTESLKSGHIAVWDRDKSALNIDNVIGVQNKTCMTLNDLVLQSDIYAVNAINQMIDSARDL